MEPKRALSYRVRGQGHLVIRLDLLPLQILLEPAHDVLEALDAFFNPKSAKLEKLDACVFDTSKSVVIGCVFSDLPSQVVLDESSVTDLGGEYLLNEDGDFDLFSYDLYKHFRDNTPEFEQLEWIALNRC